MLPVAAIEQHGPHLPVYTDTCIAEGLIRRSIELLPDDLPVTFLPVQPIGKSNEHVSSAGTITSTWETTTRLWLEIGESVHRAGVGKLIVITSHGGNVPMVDIVARELRVRHDMLAVATAWSRFGLPTDVFGPEEGRYGIHGGDFETSVMLYLRPDLVRSERAEDFRSSQEDFAIEFQYLRGHGPVQFGWKAQDLNPRARSAMPPRQAGKRQGRDRAPGAGLRCAGPRRARLRPGTAVDAMTAKGRRASGH